MSLIRASSRPATQPPVDPTVARARRLMLGLYGLLGLSVSSWLARLPSVRDTLDLSTGELGTILLVGAVGSLATVLMAGAAVARWGSRTVMLAAAVVYAVANVLLGLGPSVGSVAVLVLGVLLMSASFALGNVPLNVESSVIERRMRRTVVPQFHATFSIGAIAGSAIGAAAAWADVPVLVQFTAVSVVSLVWRLVAIPGAVLPPEVPLPAPRRACGATAADDAPPARRGAGVRAALGAWRERRTLLVGLVVMAAALSEGSANNWLAIAVVDGFERPDAVGAVVFGVFVASMTLARLVGTRLIDRFGRVRVLAVSGAFSVLGLGLFGTAPSLPLAVLGVVAWGLGAGLAVPIGMVAVSEDPLRAAGRVAVVSAFASVASIAAPPVVGLVAETVGARQALLMIVAVLLAATFLSAQVRPEAATAAVPLPTGDVPAGGLPSVVPSRVPGATLVATVLEDGAVPDVRVPEPRMPGPVTPEPSTRDAAPHADARLQEVSR